MPCGGIYIIEKKYTPENLYLLLKAIDRKDVDISQDDFLKWCWTYWSQWRSHTSTEYVLHNSRAVDIIDRILMPWNKTKKFPVNRIKKLTRITARAYSLE